MSRIIPFLKTPPTCMNLSNLPMHETSQGKLSEWLKLFGAEVLMINYIPGNTHANVRFKSIPNSDIFNTPFMGHTISVTPCNQSVQSGFSRGQVGPPVGPSPPQPPKVSITSMKKLDDGRYVCDLKLENCDGEKRIFIMNDDETTREIHQITNIEFTEDNLPAFYLFCGSGLSEKTFTDLMKASYNPSSGIQVDSKQIFEDLLKGLKLSIGGHRRGSGRRRGRKSRIRKSRKHCNRKHCNRKSRRR